LHSLDTFLESFFFSDFTANISFLKLELMKFSFMRPQNIIPALPVILEVLLFLFGVTPQMTDE
jgi:hypothetical protein